MILLIFCIVPRVLSEVSSHHVLISRKLRSHVEPIEMGYFVNSAIDDSPSVNYSNVNIKIDRLPSSGQYKLDPYTKSKILSKQADQNTAATIILPKRESITMEKSSSKDNSRFLPSKIRTDSFYEHLKSGMHYKPPFKTEKIFGYETELHIDDDDVRTSTRELYDSWPYYHYNPYEYEHMRIEAEKEKAKDKRYAVDVAKVIPIHEDLSHDIPYPQEPLLTTTEYYFTSTDNPMSGHEPFFSFMLNDYFNKNYDYQDELTLKGIDWSKDFDSGMQNNAKENTIRNRRLPSNSNTYTHSNNLVSDSVTEKGMTNKHEFDKHESGNSKNANDNTKYQNNESHHTGFKDFVDSFANKFGSEDHKKDSKYILKRNQDRGENRKGFRRVYHKDEYQEEDEFYDNNNSTVQDEDKGNSNVHIGGSEGLLKSTAYANVGSQGSSADRSGNTNNNMFENNHRGSGKNNEHNTRFHRYRDVAKQAADSNNADYTSH